MWINSLLYYFNTRILLRNIVYVIRMCTFVRSIGWLCVRGVFRAAKLNLICHSRCLSASRKVVCILKQGMVS